MEKPPLETLELGERRQLRIDGKKGRGGGGSRGLILDLNKQSICITLPAVVLLLINCRWQNENWISYVTYSLCKGLKGKIKSSCNWCGPDSISKYVMHPGQHDWWPFKIKVGKWDTTIPSKSKIKPVIAKPTDFTLELVLIWPRWSRTLVERNKAEGTNYIHLHPGSKLMFSKENICWSDFSSSNQNASDAVELKLSLINRKHMESEV